MKDWKDNEKLTGVDYTHERREVTTRLTDADTAANIKGSQLFVLSPSQPQDPYINIVWMDPNQFKMIASLSANIDSNADIQGYKTGFYQADLGTFVKLEIVFNGFKTDTELTLNPELTIESNVLVQGYKQLLHEEEPEVTINANILNQGYKQLLHEEEVLGTFNANVLPQGYKQLIVIQNYYETINTNILLEGYKNQIVTENPEININTNILLQGYKNQIIVFEKIQTLNTNILLQGYKNQIKPIVISENINNNVLLQGYKDLIEDIVVSTIIYGNSVVQGYKVKQEREFLLSTLNANGVLTGYKVELVDVEIENTTLNVNVLPQGYKVQLEDVEIENTILNANGVLTGYKVELENLEDIVDSIDAVVTPSGLKVYEVYASSNVAFSGNYLFSLNLSAFPVAISSDLTFLADAEPGDNLSFNAPLTVTEGSVKYELQSMYYTFNGDSSTQYPITPAQLIYTVSMIGRIEIYFTYRRIPIIPVLAKTTVVGGGQLSGATMAFTLLDDNGNTVDSANEAIDYNYTQYFNFEDSTDYELKLNPQDRYISGSYTAYNIDRLNIYYYNQQTSSYDLRYADSVGDIIITVDPDTVNLEPPNYDKAFYVEAQYTNEGTVANTLYYTGSYSTLSSVGTYYNVNNIPNIYLTSTSCSNGTAIIEKMEPTDWPPGQYIVVKVYVDGNLCSTPYARMLTALVP